MSMRVVHQESAWTTPNTWEISRIDLSTKASESNHLLLFWNMSMILVHHYNFLLRN